MDDSNIIRANCSHCQRRDRVILGHVEDIVALEAAHADETAWMRLALRASLQLLGEAYGRVDYLEQQADRLFVENRLLRSLRSVVTA